MLPLAITRWTVALLAQTGITAVGLEETSGALLLDPLPQLKLPYGTWQATKYDQESDVQEHFYSYSYRLTDSG